jgi:hypothetical protein
MIRYPESEVSCSFAFVATSKRSVPMVTFNAPHLHTLILLPFSAFVTSLEVFRNNENKLSTNHDFTEESMMIITI